MTRNEVIELARKVKLDAALDFDYRGSFGAMTAPEQDRLVQLEQFAALVAAHESEVCAKICDKWSRSLSSIPAREIRARAIKETP